MYHLTHMIWQFKDYFLGPKIQRVSPSLIKQSVPVKFGWG